jgi:hypothetical protein
VETIVCLKKRNDADQLQVDSHALICGREDCR